MVGKWHLSETVPLNGKPTSPEHFAWLNHQAEHDRPFADPATYPVNRGFERHYGTIWGVVNYFDPFSLVEGAAPVKSVPGDYYYTDAITAKSVEYVQSMSRQAGPFFLYVAHCAPHWPLLARPDDVNRYRETYRRGWHALRDARYRRQVEIGLINPATHPLPKLMGRGRDWDALNADERERESSLMAVHAAMVDRVDQGVGKIVQSLKDAGRYDNTIIFLLSDNGASPERYTDPGFDRPSATRDGRPIRYLGDFKPGVETTWGYIGSYWANALNTPFRYWKAESFEGGCHTPMVVHWASGSSARRGSITDQIGHVVDLMPTCLDLAGVEYPAQYGGHGLKPLEGRNLAAVLSGRQPEGRRTLFFEHEGGRAVLTDDWKLVAGARGAWELYHLADDATETRDRADTEPRRVAELERMWQAWAKRVGAAGPVEVEAR
jgi:arylsulfatase A-like enzyme